MNNPHFLTTIFTHKYFTREEQDRILAQFARVEFARNDFLLREGSIAVRHWFIESGFVRSYVTDAEGKDISTQFYAAGDIVIDWASLFLQQATRENIQALTDCVCWQVNYADFQQLFHGMEAFREQGRARLAGSYFALKNHSISLIADQAKQRYKQLLQEKPHILQHVSLKHIASYLGITDTSLSRIRKEIAEE
ncbi:cAMP-binding domain of CRP or a regulatory subunit of cAMP-dependent protein kinases [Filimonas lacunae]|uniref:cAMP-binding domain of CRP or a regulatory subunit of cAMP-dependent protein kinases n=1 Tax=Filimonas lacunae TaxID=477680 RepID=A0A173MNV4_9BACT|nr:Crp/Fnr family transcriptional regulator [Filimonas lacunae]BAV09058.1 Crp/Fnr family transcriptional regulator [Filimonas lacunae]SIS66608.1 cAMP-binding domain of CRP or a regulatory subunit of cAMP-dependent protein kinases [Filimonas lacunae]